MLSVKNLVKVYKTKNGAEVRALDGVSIDFPSKGMVFLLGKSGSGKSTLLNVSGGLDFPTDGEIIVDGRSSKDFTVADFDGYRNSCVGFVFQEFNILNEFNIEQNIALALQLQQKPNNAQVVEEILETVDLAGYGKRKPNTLSGGQKQRIAIARALIKDPKIIMADEPTGALDSATGKQVLDTLKKLSKNRLVVVVTHDREFAQEYGDRIIELADGKIISDLTLEKEETKDETQENVTVLSDNTIKVHDWSKVKEEDVRKIVDVMKTRGGTSYVTSDEEFIDGIKQKHRDTGVKRSRKFKTTDTSQPIEEKGGDVKFIKSNLPFKNAFKMSWDSLRLKPIRLCFTIFLSVVAFILFGVASSFMMYDRNFTIATALRDSDYDSLVLRKSYDARYTSFVSSLNGMDVEEKDLTSTQYAAYSKQDIDEINKNDKGLKFAGIIDFGSYVNKLDSVEGYSPKKDNFSFSSTSLSLAMEYSKYYSVRGLIGFCDAGEEYLDQCGFELYGSYPKNPREIVVSEYIYSMFKNNTYRYQGVEVDIQNHDDFIGKSVKIGTTDFTISGIVDVGEIPARFRELYNPNTELNTAGIETLESQFKDILESSFHVVGFVSEDFYDYYVNEAKFSKRILYDRSIYGMKFAIEPITSGVPQNFSGMAFTEKSVWKNTDMIKAFDLEGKERDLSIDKNQVLLPIGYVTSYADALKNAIKEQIMLATPEIAQDLEIEYADYFENCTRLNAGTASIEDKLMIADTLFNYYERFVGQSMVFPENVYARSYKHDQTLSLNDRRDVEKTNFKLEVVGFYMVTKGTNVDFYDVRQNNVNAKYFVSDDLCDEYAELFASKVSEDTNNNVYFSDYDHDPINEIYGKIITPTDNTDEQTLFMLKYGKDAYNTAFKNELYAASINVAKVIEDMKPAFYIAGGVIGVFATLMLYNFISVTINSKKREIGILRAVGARRIDVFKIFIIEALTITLSCFVISSALSIVACSIINGFTTNSVFGLSALSFGLINTAILLGISTAVAFLATVLPVWRASKKAPVESIRSI